MDLRGVGGAVRNLLGEGRREAVLAKFAAPPEPGGLYEARCLETFSRWRWAAGDADGAIACAKRAILADATWPKGHMMLGWYGLMSGKFDPLPHLREAVRITPASLEQLRANEQFSRHPELIAALATRP